MQGRETSEVRRNVSTVSKYEVTESDSLEMFESLHNRTQSTSCFRGTDRYICLYLHKAGRKNLNYKKTFFP
jgi:hypothetical protein